MVQFPFYQRHIGGVFVALVYLLNKRFKFHGAVLRHQLHILLVKCVDTVNKILVMFLARFLGDVGH